MKFIKPVFLALFFFLIAACSNEIAAPVYTPLQTDTPETSTPAAAPQYVTLTGSITFSGAYPVNFIQQNEESNRSAFPGLPSSLTYSGTATAVIGGVTKSANVTIDTSTFTYTITNIEVTSEEVNWTVTIEAKDGTTPVLSESKTLPLSSVNPIYNYDFELKPLASGNGTIALTMTVPGTVKRVTATCSDSRWTSAAPAISVSSTTVSITEDSIPAGAYSVQFDFWSSTSGGYILYSDTQVINICTNLSTGLWINNGGSSPIVVTNTTTGEQGYVLTASHLEQFAMTTFYVGTNSWGTAAATNSGTIFAPLQTLAQAESKIITRNKATENYTILVTGSLSGAQTLSSNLDGKAASITIKGARGLNSGVPQDSLNGGFIESSRGTTLSIGTSVSVIITNIMITGGWGGTNTAGGISIQSTANVTISDGALITQNTGIRGGGINNSGILKLAGGVISKNTAWYNGGGIYNTATGKIFVYGSAVIGGDSEADKNMTEDETSGGGIYTLGKTYLGYSSANNDGTPNTETEWTGKISYNEGQVAGGIVVGNSTVLYFNSGTINNNYMTGGEGGGGIALTTGTTAYITGGTISDNIAEENTGGAIYIDDGILNISGSAYIPAGTYQSNDIWFNRYSNTSASINITSALSRHTASDTISVYVYDIQKGTAVLGGATVSSDYDKFISKIPGYKFLNDGTVAFKYTPSTIYVSSTTGSDPSGGTIYNDTWNNESYSYNDTATYQQNHPFRTLKKALQFITYMQTPQAYTISISGTITNGQTIGNDTTVNFPITLDTSTTATKITLTGTAGNSSDILDCDGDQGVATLVINTGVPVEVTYLSITGAYNPGRLGGGIRVEEGATLYLGSGTKIFENTAACGGGVCNKGTLIIKGNTTIGDITSRTAAAPSDGGSNKAVEYGGGIYTTGTVWMGYTAAAINSPDTSFSGGIGYNSAAKSGGGIYIADGGIVYMSKGQISYNSSNGNAAANGGGGVYIAATDQTTRGLFYMYGGSITINEHKGTNGGGGGVYISGYTKMIMSGDAKIPYEAIKKSDVYSEKAGAWSGHIEVTGALSNTAVATIVPSGLEAGRKLVTLDTDQTDWDTITPKFLLQSTETSIAYYGLDEGCLWPNMDIWGTGMATNFANSSGTLLTASNGTEIMHSVIDATVVIVDSSNNTLVLNISRIQDDMSGKVYKLKFKNGAQPVVTRYFTFADIDFISEEKMYYNTSGDELGGNGTAVIGITNLHGNTSNPIISLYAEPRTSKYLVLPTMYD